MTAAVTLHWEDPDDAAEFLLIRDQYRRDGWLTDPARDALLDLLRSGEVRDGGWREKGSTDGR